MNSYKVVLELKTPLMLLLPFSIGLRAFYDDRMVLCYIWYSFLQIHFQILWLYGNFIDVFT